IREHAHGVRGEQKLANLRPFRFGVIVYQAKSKDEWVAKAQRAENLGYSTFLVPDHLEDQLAAVPALVAAAEATSSIRIGSSVFDNDFRHPVMLAKEDRKSTRLNSSHVKISYAVFCLKKKKKKKKI